MSDIQSDIEEIINQLPLEHPQQLYLRKGNEYVASYDPVYEITINEHSIDIKADPYTYNHSYDVFDRIYIVPNGDEPLDLNKGQL